MPRIVLTLTFLLLAAACGDGDAVVTTTAPATSAAATTASPTTTAGTAPTIALATTSTTAAVTVNPLTNRDIREEELLLMTMNPESIGAEFAGFTVDRQAVEPNDVAASRALLDPADEAADIERYGRENGARAAFRASRLPVSRRGILEVHTAVSLFGSEEGAAGYLDDFFTDAAKGIGGARPTDLNVTGMDPFVVDPIGEQVIGLTLEETIFGETEPARFETLVAFRVGRLLAFGSLVHADPDDFRLRAQQFGERFHEHTLAVLRGNIRVPEPEPPPEPLEAFAFAYSQLVDRRLVRAEIEAEGIVVLPDRVACTVNTTVDGLPDDKRYVVIGERSWFDVLGDGFDTLQELNRDTHFLNQDLLFCPGWAVPLDASGLDLAIAGKLGTPTDVAGEPGRAYVLGKAELVAAGLLDPEWEIEVKRFQLTAADRGDWLLGLQLELVGSAPEMVKAFGSDFAGAAGERVTLEFGMEVTRINDPELAVESPEGEG